MGARWNAERTTRTGSPSEAGSDVHPQTTGGRHETGAHTGGSRVPRRTSHLLHHPDSRRAPRAGASGFIANPRADGHQPQDPERPRARSTELAGRMGRQGLDSHPAPDLGRRDAIGVRPGAAELQYQDGRPGDRRIRLRGEQETLPAADGQHRHLVVPGLLRARAGSDLASLRTTAVRDGDTTSSTARRPGPRWRNTPTGSSAWCAPTRRRPRSRPAFRFC